MLQPDPFQLADVIAIVFVLWWILFHHWLCGWCYCHPISVLQLLCGRCYCQGGRWKSLLWVGVEVLSDVIAMSDRWNNHWVNFYFNFSSGLLHRTSSHVRMVIYWGRSLLMFFEPLSKCSCWFTNILLITLHPFTFISINDSTFSGYNLYPLEP